MITPRSAIIATRSQDGGLSKLAPSPERNAKHVRDHRGTLPPSARAGGSRPDSLESRAACLDYGRNRREEARLQA